MTNTDLSYAGLLELVGDLEARLAQAQDALREIADYQGPSSVGLADSGGGMSKLRALARAALAGDTT